MAILYSPEYEGKVEYIYSEMVGRLATPAGLSSVDTSVLFDKVHSATSYSIYLDGKEFDTVPLLGSGIQYWLFNELISIEENTEVAFNSTFICNNVTYSAIKVYGGNKTPAGNGKYAIYFDNTKVFEERTDGNSLWLDQAYRLISFSSASAALLEFLESAAVEQPEQLSIDLSTLTGWDNLEDGDYILQLVARNSSESSFLSKAINFAKNAGFIKGHIYGPYSVVRTVDGDTLVATINGADMKIRLIGVDTPESVASAGTGKTNCPEGKEASDYTKAQLTGQQVYIEFDTDQYDKYNRYLCYIYWDKQGTQMYNAQLISNGYAEAKYYSPNGAHRPYLEACMATAEQNNVGFWGTGFFPTKLRAPIITLTGSILTWPLNAYAGTYDIRSNSTSVYTFTPLVGSTQNSLDLSTLSLSSGQNKIKIRAIPINSAHSESNLSNQVIYTVS